MQEDRRREPVVRTWPMQMPRCMGTFCHEGLILQHFLNNPVLAPGVFGVTANLKWALYILLSLPQQSQPPASYLDIHILRFMLTPELCLAVSSCRLGLSMVLLPE